MFIKKFVIFAFALLAFAALNPARIVSAQTVKADYRFQNSRQSSIAAAPDLTDLGSNGANTFATVAAEGEPRVVLQFPFSNGLRLAPTTGVVPNDVYTIVILFEFDNININTYKRILDFKNGTSENGFYQKGNYLSFYIGSEIASGRVFLHPDVYHQIVLTRNAAGTVTAYADGVQQFTFDDSVLRAGVIDSNNVLRFFRDNEGSPEHTSGSVARIRLYDTALTADEVAALDRFSNAPPTAATASIGGRVLNADGDTAVTRASVTLTDTIGNTKTVLTNPFGYYRFENVPAGESYVLRVVSKQYFFTPRVISVTDKMSELNLIAEP